MGSMADKQGSAVTSRLPWLALLAPSRPGPGLALIHPPKRRPSIHLRYPRAHTVHTIRLRAHTLSLALFLTHAHTLAYGLEPELEQPAAKDAPIAPTVTHHRAIFQLGVPFLSTCLQVMTYSTYALSRLSHFLTMCTKKKTTGICKINGASPKASMSDGCTA